MGPVTAVTGPMLCGHGSAWVRMYTAQQHMHGKQPRYSHHPGSFSGQELHENLCMCRSSASPFVKQQRSSMNVLLKQRLCMHVLFCRLTLSTNVISQTRSGAFASSVASWSLWSCSVAGRGEAGDGSANYGTGSTSSTDQRHKEHGDLKLASVARRRH
jgi:hypothetical protein